MLSKKILIDGAEAYVQSNKNPAGDVTVSWIINSVLRRIRLVRINHNFITDVMKFEYIFAADEILNLNGFDYSAADPNYDLIETAIISSERVASEVPIPDLSFQAPSPFSPVTAVSLFPINGIFYKHFGAKAQEDIVDFVGGAFRQPFYFEPVLTHETAPDADDGVIALENAWGGDAPLEYSADNGVTWQAGEQFTGLAPGTYFVKVKDAQGNESTTRELTIEQAD